MTSQLLLPFALLGLVTSGVVSAQEVAVPEVEQLEAEDETVEASQEVETSQTNAVEEDAVEEVVRSRVITDLTKPASLVEFDGARQVLKRAQRLRIMYQSAGYTMKIGADGKAISCEVKERFRQAFIGISLCNTLMKHHEFESARDANGNPVEGTYTNRLYYNDLREEIAK